MSISINIRGTIINFPSSGQSANWAPPIIQFAQAVTSSLNLAIGEFDIPPQTLDIGGVLNGALTDVTNLLFANDEVRSATITISTFRTIATPSVVGAGTVVEVREVNVVYNPTASSTNKWYISQERTGNASIAFSITDAGQVQFTLTSIGSGATTGIISFVGKALTQV